MATRIDASFTLLAATHADLELTGRVARALEKRVARVHVLDDAPASGRQTCDAVVSSTTAERLGRLLDGLRLQPPRQGLPIVLVHPQPDAAHYALALRRGLGDVIAWPQEIERWCSTLGKDGEGDAAAEAAPPLLGRSEPMQRLRQRIERVAAFDSNVLLTGETGSGKECVAAAIHAASARRDKPMISLNCAAIPEQLVESELFGFERGAFTGAHAAQPGKFALAEGGMLFLDEIGDMPLAAQAKILRVIESREYFRLGGTRSQRSDVRLIAATHQDLGKLCEAGGFRLDLYFRLNVAHIELPPLRERGGDVQLLAEQFLAECHRRSCRKLAFEPAVREALAQYAWPGNVRELRNAVEVAAINADGGLIRLEDLPPQIMRWAATRQAPPDERSQLATLLERLHWNKSEVARELNWSRMKLYRKLKLYGLAGEGDAAP
ncbi:sigma-54 interaction domain-containing protein [Chitinimonas koreensis]|uniref:sigma-54 interaction domain-containing protein n=1 Tax=Chitinimonas koreensis TaxID=356302 RepID=UPI0003FF007A|nr:sigma-54 dependent transcriptional regulator [Chitinimonas koreensis]QNM98664.1 sigma-54-dependent Fis family transcriptional regulator [Chitinimonas koreensis]